MSYSRNKERELYGESGYPFLFCLDSLGSTTRPAVHFTAVTDTLKTAIIISSGSYRSPTSISFYLAEDSFGHI
jgi:hypothetical protein